MAEEENKNKNAFEKIAEFYEDSVAEEDAAHPDNAETFKKAMECVIKDMASAEDFHIIDEKYLDGYFIMGTGTNSVVHFHVKECPHWEFGIWWDIDEQGVVTGDCFAQHEDWIDKFKPTASALCVSIRYFINSEHMDLYKAIEMFTFIKKYPYHAFYGHMHWLSEYQVVSWFEAFRFRVKFILDQKKEKRCNEKVRKQTTRWINKHFARFCKKYKGTFFKIHDNGENWSPRFMPNIFYTQEAVETAGFEEDLEELEKEYKWACQRIENKNNVLNGKFSTWINYYEVVEEEGESSNAEGEGEDDNHA